MLCDKCKKRSTENLHDITVSTANKEHLIMPEKLTDPKTLLIPWMLILRVAKSCRRRQDPRCYLFISSFVFTMLYILIQDEYLYHNRDLQEMKMYGVDQNDTGNIRDEKTNTKRGITSSKTPLIFFHTRRLHTPLVYDGDCEITRDPARFDESHAVVFHAKDLPLPRSIAKRRHNRDQAWVYFNLESPKNTRKVEKNEMLFNLTITPIRESDIVHPYGYFAEIEEETPIDLDVPDKNSLAAWCVSNCKVGFRNKFVTLLQRYIKVDVYGACSQMFGKRAICERNSRGCSRFLRKYKFYLAFENSLCKDYVTEKYWEALDRWNVPVVLAANIDTLIPGSFIDARKFKTVKDLAKYLQYLDQNYDAYLKYFDWRKKYTLDVVTQDALRTDNWLPELCDFLVDGDWSERRIVNISEFYGVESNCPRKHFDEVMTIIDGGV